MFNKQWGKKHREAGRQETAEDLKDVLARVDLSPEVRTKIEEGLDAKRAEREKQPA